MPKKAKSQAKPRKVRRKKLPKAAPQEMTPKPVKKVTRYDYIFAVGRRKKAIARVRLYFKKENSILINNRPAAEYFPQEKLQQIVKSPVNLIHPDGTFSIYLAGGGKNSQAEAARLGISRAIIKKSPECRKHLKVAGFLTRDAREKERKKYGLKRARRAPQWQKR